MLNCVLNGKIKQTTKQPIVNEVWHQNYVSTSLELQFELLHYELDVYTEFFLVTQTLKNKEIQSPFTLLYKLTLSHTQYTRCKGIFMTMNWEEKLQM